MASLITVARDSWEDIVKQNQSPQNIPKHYYFN